MRLVSLLVVLLVVGWLVHSQLGAGPAPAEEPAWRQAQDKAATVEPLVQDQFARQADSLSRMEAGGAP